MAGLNLESYIKLDRSVIDSANLCDRFSDHDLTSIGAYCLNALERDKQSRIQWLNRTQAALDLAMQVQQEKTFPWPNCSNIVFPLVTIAAMQFHARAYPTIVQGKDVVKCRVVGPDPTGAAKARAENISAHMSWQLTEQDEAWEEDTDRALLNLAIVGCGFKKSYYDDELGHNVSCYVPAQDLVVNYWAKSVETAQVKTQLIPMDRNKMHSRIESGVFRDIRKEAWYDEPPADVERHPDSDNRNGLEAPDADYDSPFHMCEQHTWLDLDNDGYAEPYIVTFEETTGCVVRIVTRFDRDEDIKRTSSGAIIRISPWEYYTKMPFIPSPDGGLLDIGFGILLGPLNESVNAAINQLFDAGTLSNTSGGFLGKGAKIRGGVYDFAPFSWNRVDSTGDDLRKNIVPLPVREPSGVIFNLLGLIIDYTNRISSTTDLNVGESIGQNTPAHTAQMMSEQGQKIYTAIYKRLWRSLRKEYQKLYQLNSVYLPAKFTYGAGATIGREDYLGPASGVVPVADPSIASEAQRYARAAAVKQLSIGNPAYDADKVEQEILRALGVEDVDAIYKGVESAPPPQPDVRIQIEGMRSQIAMAQLEWKKQEFLVTIQQTARINEAKIAEIQAKILKIHEEGSAVSKKQQIDAFRASMELIREQNKGLDGQMKMIMEIGKNELASTAGQGAISGLEGPSSNQGILPPAGIA